MSDEEELLVIAAKGDLVIDVAQEEGGQRFLYRVDSKTLQQNSRYFENLLSDRFSEGQQLAKALGALELGGHGDMQMCLLMYCLTFQSSMLDESL